MVVLARALADAAEVGPHRGIAQVAEGARQGVGDLVGVGAVEERMRVGHHGDPAGLLGASMSASMVPSGPFSNARSVGRGVTWGSPGLLPQAQALDDLALRRCRSMISSMSSLST